MKLGLNIEITSQGAGSAALTLNSTPALERYASASRSIIKEVFPAREDLKQKGINESLSLDESQRSVIFVRFLGSQGYLICIFQARPENSGRPYDGAAAWIHVPASVALSGKETERLIDEVEAAFSNEKGVDNLRLEALFSNDYQEINAVPAIVRIASNGTSSAVRFYGNGTDYQLSELLGNGIAQPEYSRYKAIFFLRKSENIAFSGREITSPLVQTCIIAPPSKKADFLPYFENGTPFSKPIEVPVNSIVNVIWKKQGYQDINKTIRAQASDADTFNSILGIRKEDIRFAVLKKWFRVHSGNKLLPHFQIKVENQVLDDVIYLPESKIEMGINVKVTAEGYETFHKDIKLSTGIMRNGIEIPMKKEMRHYEFSIPLYVGKEQLEEDGIIRLDTNRRITECPVKGYSLMSGEHVERDYVNRLEYGKFSESFKQFAYGFLTCLGLFLLISLYNVIDDIDHVNYKLGWPPIEFVKQSDNNLTPPNDGTEDNVIDTDNPANSSDYYTQERAITYLNSTDTWCKDSIVNYPSLQGLFDDLNEFNFDEITNKWANELKDVTGFNKVVQAVTLAKCEGRDPRQGTHNPNYNADNDNKISLKNYASWISTDQAQKPAESNQQQPVKHITTTTPAAKPKQPASKPTIKTPPAAKPANPENGNTNKNKRGAV